MEEKSNFSAALFIHTERRPASIDFTEDDNTKIVVPLMSFVFGFPLLVIAILCIVQQRTKRLRKARLRKQQFPPQPQLHSSVHQFSSTSGTIYSSALQGTRPSSRLTLLTNDERRSRGPSFSDIRKTGTGSGFSCQNSETGYSRQSSLLVTQEQQPQQLPPLFPTSPTTNGIPWVEPAVILKAVPTPSQPIREEQHESRQPIREQLQHKHGKSQWIDNSEICIQNNNAHHEQ